MNNDSGNALFLILIAVALFAALSYAITQSGRGGGSIDKEQAEIIAAQITQYGSTIEQAINRLSVINGCARTEYNFENDFDANYVNTLAPMDGSCDVFSADGANATFQKMPAGTGDENGYPLFIAVRINSIGSSAGSASRDISFFAPIKSEAVCSAINRNLGLPSDFAIDGIVAASAIDSWKYKGNNFPGNVIPDEAGNVAGFAGKYAACIQTTTDTTQYPSNLGIGYFYYHVLSPG